MNSEEHRAEVAVTPLPEIPDLPPDIFRADEFCASRQIRARVCPVDANQRDKRLVGGENKRYVDFDEGILQFVETNGRGPCIGQCPWSRTGTAPRLAEKISRHRAGHSVRA